MLVIAAIDLVWQRIRSNELHKFSGCTSQTELPRPTNRRARSIASNPNSPATATHPRIARRSWPRSMHREIAAISCGALIAGCVDSSLPNGSLFDSGVSSAKELTVGCVMNADQADCITPRHEHLRSALNTTHIVDSQQQLRTGQHGNSTTAKSFSTTVVVDEYDAGPAIAAQATTADGRTLAWRSCAHCVAPCSPLSVSVSALMNAASRPNRQRRNHQTCRNQTTDTARTIRA